MTVNIGALDLTVIVVYLVGIVALGCWAGLRQRRMKTGGGNDYFLAGGTLTWPFIGMALFSTNISTVHLVSLAEEGYKNGLVYGNTEWMAAFTLMILAVVFAPFYLRARVATLPDFLEKRYSRGSRNWLAGMSIISAIFIHIGFTLYTGGVVLRGLFGFDLNTSIVSMALLTGLYTIVGGLLAVVMTETIQTVIMLVGAVCLTAICYVKVGGWDGLAASVDPVKLTVLRDTGDPSGMPWYAALLGYPVIGIWYWCTDQTIVQRVLGAKNEHHARTGPLFAGFIKILPMFILVLPGLMCAGLIQQGKLPALENSQDTYAFMIHHLLPAGLTGLMAAALLAAAMSTVSGALNSIATLFTYDLYKQWSPAADDRRLVTVGRLATFVSMVLAILWSVFGIGTAGRTIFQQFAAMICYMAPSITVTFLLGVFWRGASSFGSFFTLVAGSLMGLAGFVVSAYKDRVPTFQSIFDLPPIGFILNNFWMASFYLGLICLALHVAASLARPDAPTPARQALVWKSFGEMFTDREGKGLGNYKVVAAVLFAVMIVLYIVFR